MSDVGRKAVSDVSPSALCNFLPFGSCLSSALISLSGELRHELVSQILFQHLCCFYCQCLLTATEQTRIEIGSPMEYCYDDVFKFFEFCHRNLFMLTSVSSNMAHWSWAPPIWGTVGGFRLALSLVYSRQEARTFKGAFPSPYVCLSGERCFERKF